jgi:hypothetical protein
MGKWLDWLLWWRISEAEVRLEVDGYATMRRITTARGFGCFLSLIYAGYAAYLCIKTYSQENPELNYFAVLSLAVSVGYIVLGWLMLRGSRVAAAALMAVCTLDKLNCLYFVYVAELSGYRLPLFVLLCVLAWSMVLHVFYTAYRVERARTQVA